MTTQNMHDTSELLQVDMPDWLQDIIRIQRTTETRNLEMEENPAPAIPGKIPLTDALSVDPDGTDKLTYMLEVRKRFPTMAFPKSVMEPCAERPYNSYGEQQDAEYVKKTAMLLFLSGDLNSDLAKRTRKILHGLTEFGVMGWRKKCDPIHR